MHACPTNDTSMDILNSEDLRHISMISRSRYEENALWTSDTGGKTEHMRVVTCSKLPSSNARNCGGEKLSEGM